MIRSNDTAGRGAGDARINRGHGQAMDIRNDPLILGDHPRVLGLVRKDLRTICRVIDGAMPRCTILLTGSLSVNEGRCLEERPERALESDYDIVVVTDSCLDAIPRVADRKLQGLLGNNSLSADLEITLVWKPLITLRLTTTAGRIIEGDHRLSGALRRLHAPSAPSALANAYCALAGAPITPPPARCDQLGKALVKAAQGFLLRRCAGTWRKQWIGLSSIRVIRARLEGCEDLVGRAETARIRQACAHLLKETRLEWDMEHFGLVKDTLGCIAKTIPSPVSLFQTIKHASWLAKMGLPGLPRPSAGAHALRGLQWLSRAWGKDGSPDPAMLLKAGREVSRLAPGIRPSDREAPAQTYLRFYGILKSYVSYYPNKLAYSLGRDPSAKSTPSAEQGAAGGLVLNCIIGRNN